MTAGIIGAAGYAGAELVRLLSGHPKIDKLLLSSVTFEGSSLEDVYPNFINCAGGPLLKAEDVIASSGVVFAALPNGVGEGYADACIGRGVSYIDLSADFRFGEDEEVYAAWYGKPYQFPELRRRSVYGLVELNRKKIVELSVQGALVIGNPGCYPTGASLAAFPALAKGLYSGKAQIIVDAVSGITGGGREPSRSFHYPECADSVSAYKTGSHRHSPEIAANFRAMASGSPNGAPEVVFSPHLAPLNRGILSTVYIPLESNWRVTRAGGSRAGVLPPSGEIEEKADEVRTFYKDFYKDEPFVRVLPSGVNAATNRVRQSNFCDISVNLDSGGSVLIAVSAIDNMVKGAAGQAVQNMNVIFNFDERAGLNAVPSVF